MIDQQRIREIAGMMTGWDGDTKAAFLLLFSEIKCLTAETGAANAELARLTAERDEAKKTADRIYDCHGGPGMAEPACGGCISCLTNALVNAEAERDEATAKERAAVVTWLLADPKGWGEKLQRPGEGFAEDIDAGAHLVSP